MSIDLSLDIFSPIAAMDAIRLILAPGLLQISNALLVLWP